MGHKIPKKNEGKGGMGNPALPQWFCKSCKRSIPSTKSLCKSCVNRIMRRD